IRAIGRCVAPPRRFDERRAADQVGDETRPPQLCAIRLVERVTRGNVAVPRVEHDGDVSARWRDRHGPGPEIIVALDECMRRILLVRPRIALPNTDDGGRPRGLFAASIAGARDDAGAPAAVEHPPRATDSRAGVGIIFY